MSDDRLDLDHLEELAEHASRTTGIVAITDNLAHLLVEQARKLQAENERLKHELVATEASRMEEIKRLRETCVAYSRRDIAVTTERDAAREQVRQRDEVIERVRALADEFAGTHGATEAYCADRIRTALDERCPTCGSVDRFRLRPDCGSDTVDPDPWHRAALDGER